MKITIVFLCHNFSSHCQKKWNSIFHATDRLLKITVYVDIFWTLNMPLFTSIVSFFGKFIVKNCEFESVFHARHIHNHLWIHLHSDKSVCCCIEKFNEKLYLCNTLRCGCIRWSMNHTLWINAVERRCYKLIIKWKWYIFIKVWINSYSDWLHWIDSENLYRKNFIAYSEVYDIRICCIDKQCKTHTHRTAKQKYFSERLINGDRQHQGEVPASTIVMFAFAEKNECANSIHMLIDHQISVLSKCYPRECSTNMVKIL